MPECTTYSPKEIAAFQGLFSLAASGKDFSRIKVQDIATAAGMGKGTLYEYFPSKEAILSSAVLYALERALDWMERQLSEEDSLYKGLDHFLEELQAEHILPFSALTALGSMISSEQRKQISEQNREKLQKIFLRMRLCERQFFEAGRRNGEIAWELDDSFCEYVIICALVGMAGKNLCAQQQSDSKPEWNMVRQLIFRSLRP